MSILRYEKPDTRPRPSLAADEALLRLLLIIGGVMVGLLLWGWSCTRFWTGINSDLKLWGSYYLAIGGSALAVLRWVLRPLWSRRYEGSAGVWGVMLLGLLFPVMLLLLGWLFCSFPAMEWTG